MSLPQYHHHHSTRFRPKKSFLTTPQKRILAYIGALVVIALFITVSIKYGSEDSTEIRLKNSNQDLSDDDLKADNSEFELVKQKLINDGVELNVDDPQTEEELLAEIDAIDDEIARKKEIQGAADSNDDQLKEKSPELLNEQVEQAEKIEPVEPVAQVQQFKEKQLD